MNDSAYHLPVFGTLLSHFPGPPPVVRDGSDSASARVEADDSDEAAELLIRARVKSGDYFITLATELDKTAQGLSRVRAPEAPDLERIVSELLFLHDNYRLVKK